MFKNLKIGMRLGLGFGAVLGLLTAISVMGIVQMAGLHDGIGESSAGSQLMMGTSDPYIDFRLSSGWAISSAERFRRCV
jgi:hypothetical protein